MPTTLNPTDIGEGLVLSNGDLTATAATDAAVAARSTVGQTSGKFYFEVFCSSVAPSGMTGCGVCTAAAAIYATPIYAPVLTIQTPGWVSVMASGVIFIDGVSPNIGGYPLAISSLFSYPVSGVYEATRCIAVDLTHSRIWFRTNHEAWNADTSADPAANLGGLDISGLFPTHPAFAGVGVQVALTLPTSTTVNFGDTAFAYPAPSGFSGGPTGVASASLTGRANGIGGASSISPLLTTGHADGRATAHGVARPPAHGALAVIGV